MGNINEYKKRFEILLESTMGDVRPMISEDQEFNTYITPTLDMLTFEGEDEEHKDFVPNVTVTGSEYFVTLPEATYQASSFIGINVIYPLTTSPSWNKNKNLNIPPEVPLPYQSNTNKLEIPTKSTENKQDPSGTSNIIRFDIRIPNTQAEFDSNQPYGGSFTVPCLNVRGGKIKISFKIEPGATIIDTSQFKTAPQAKQVVTPYTGDGSEENFPAPQPN